MPCTSSSSAGGKIASASDISLDSFLRASTSSHHNGSRGGADVELPLDDGVSFARLQSPCPGTYTAFFFCFFFLLPVGLSGTTVLRPQLLLLQGSPCPSWTLGGVWGWICAPNWPKVGGAAPGFEPRTSCMRVRSASHYATEAAPTYTA